MDADTIVAVATPPGGARRGIVRLSGPRAAELVRGVLAAAEPAFDPEHERQLVRGELDDGRGLQPVRVLWMKGPRSFTREDVAELHLSGAEPLLAAALARLVALGARVARPGEFTRRAFRSGRIDLSRAEGVLALTEAANEAERAAAVQLVRGGLDHRAAALREALLALATLCEASLDFDEAETGHVPRAELLASLAEAEAALAEALRWEVRRAPPSALPRVLLVGAPNAGKSSLWNALSGGRALVSDLAGTTRDVLVARVDLGETSCLLVDAPGVDVAARDSGAAGPDAKAQELRAREEEAADVRVLVADAAAPAGALPPDLAPVGTALLVRSQVDRLDAAARAALPAAPGGVPTVLVSARTGEGLDALRAELAHVLDGRAAAAGESGGLARLVLERHREALRAAHGALAEARALLAGGAPLDLVAEALRAALASLDDLAGRTTSEDVLDRIFARFCLGK